LRGLFSAFPGGRFGVALIILRCGLGLALVLDGVNSLAESFGWVALTGGALLTIGFLTPLVSIVMALEASAITFVLLPGHAPTLFGTGASIILASATFLALALMGPGAFSVDARLFGRREILIPPASRFPARTPSSAGSDSRIE
jgi:hypothetical protein